MNVAFIVFKTALSIVLCLHFGVYTAYVFIVILWTVVTSKRLRDFFCLSVPASLFAFCYILYLFDKI